MFSRIKEFLTYVKDEKFPFSTWKIFAFIILFATITGVSYSFFNATISGNNSAKQNEAKSGNLSIKFTNTNKIDEENATPGWSEAKTFTVENDGDYETSYYINFASVINELVNNEALTYTLVGKNENNTEIARIENETLPSTGNHINILGSKKIAAGKTHTYTLTIKYASDAEQESDINKEIQTKLEVLSGDGTFEKGNITITLNSATGGQLKAEDTTQSTNSVANSNGTNTLTVKKGDHVKVTAIPNSGYKLNTLKQGTENISNNYSFTASENLTFNATWTLTQRTVNIVVYNGTVDPSNKRVNYGGSETFTITPTSGYEASNADISCTNASISGNTLTVSNVTSNQTCTVTLKPISYTISYNLAGGSVSTANPTSYTVTTDAITLNNPTKTGYTFAGWTGTGLTSATKTVTIAKGSTGNRSYTATWTANSYTVAFTMNGASAISNKTVNYDSEFSVTKPTKTFTVSITNNTGATLSATSASKAQTFAGWTANSNLSTSTAKYGSASGSASTAWSNKDTKVGASNSATYFKNLRTASGTVTLTANWTAVGITLPTITAPKGQTCTYSNGASSGGTYTPSTTTNSASLSVACSTNSYTCSAGQYLKADETSCSSCPAGSYCPGGTYAFNSTSNQGINACPTADSGWTKTSPAGSDNYNDCYETQTPSGCASGTVKRVGSSATAYSSTITLNSTLKSSAGYYASSTATSCTKCTAGNYCPASSTSETSCPAADSGWSKTSPAGSDNYDDCYETQTPANCSAGTVKRVGSSASAYSSTVTVATALSANSKYYVNGTSCSACTEGYYCTGGTANKVACAVGSYSTGTSSTCTACAAGKTTSGTASTSSSACTTCSNSSNVSGWGTQTWSANSVSNLCVINSCNTGYTKSGSSPYTCNINKYTVNVTVNNGTVEPSSKTINYGSNGEFTITPTSGYEATNADISCTNASISGNTLTVSNVTSNQTCTVTLKPISYTISYNLAGGSVSTANPTSYTVTTDAITLNNPTKTGYTFAGWTGTGLTSATKTVTIAKGSTGNRSYTATWTANSYTVAFTMNGASAISNKTVNYDSEFSVTKPTKTFTVSITNNTGATLSATSASKAQTFAGWTADSNLSTSTAKYGSASGSASTAWSSASTKVGASNEATYFKNLRTASGTVTLTANWTAVGITLPTITAPKGQTCTFSNGASSGGTYTPSTTTNSASLSVTCSTNSYTCSAGKYLKADETSCSSCPAGSYCKGGTYAFNSTSNQGINACPTADSGWSRTSPAGSDNYNDCYETQTPSGCASGTVKRVGSSASAYSSTITLVSTLKSSAGYYASSTATSCTKCTAGNYCPASSTSETSCPAADSGWSKTSPAGSDNYDDCYETQTPSGCASGTVKRVGSSASAYSSTITNVSALTAKAGYYTTSTSCPACAVGSYSTAGANTCTACAAGKTTSGTASTSSSACTTCSNSSNVSGWGTQTWSANSVSNLCVINSCNTGYTKSGSSPYTCNINKYTVNVTVNNGTVNTSSKTVNHGSSGTFTITPSTGYGSPTVTCTNSQSASISGNTLTISNVTNNTTCSVTYNKNSYTLTMNPNGGSWNGTTSNTTVTKKYQETYDVTNNATRSGYVFNGWKLTSGKGDITWFKDSDVLTSYKITSASSSKPSVYNNSSGGAVTHQIISDSTSSTGYSVKITTNGTASPGAGGFYNNTTSVSGAFFYHKIVAKVPSGYTLEIASNSRGIGAGQYWLTDNIGDGTWKTYIYVTPCGINGSFSSFGHVYASGSNNTSVTWYLQESTMYKISSSLATTQATTMGFKFLDSNATLTAQWNASGSRVTFNANNGTFASGTTTAMDFTYTSAYTSEKKAPYYIDSSTYNISRTGYTFKGWYTAATGGTQVFNARGQLNASVSGYSDASRVWQKYDQNITLYAQWETNSYTITINSGTGGSTKVEDTTKGTSATATSGGSTTLTVNYGDTIKVTATPNTGYNLSTLKHGSTSISSGGTYTYNITSGETVSSTFTLKQYTVNVTVNNGTVVGSTTKTALFLEGTNFNLTPSNAYYKNPTVNCDNATGEMNGNTLQVTNVTGNTTCTVTYKFEITPKEIADIIYPVGSIIKNDNSSFDPNVFYPGTTWVKESGVGFEYASGTKTAGSTGGYTDAVVPSHTHKFVGAVGAFDSAGAHTHTVSYGTNGITTSGSSSHKIATTSAATKTLAAPTAAQGLAHTHTVTPAGTVGSTGTTTTNANLPSYYVVNIWRRTN